VTRCSIGAGIAEPIKGGVEVGLRLGLGKAEEDRHYTSAENIVRKRLEVELQASEDAERTQRREVRYIPGFLKDCTLIGLFLEPAGTGIITVMWNHWCLT